MIGQYIRRVCVLSFCAFALATTVHTGAFAQDDGLEEVIVTGSRIVRRDYSAQTPIVTVDAEAFSQRSNFGLEATLNQLPQFNILRAQRLAPPRSTFAASARTARWCCSTGGACNP